MDNTLWTAGARLGMFVLGTQLGSWTEARRWREKAKNGFCIASGNALFEVRKVFDFDFGQPTPPEREP